MNPAEKRSVCEAVVIHILVECAPLHTVIFRVQCNRTYLRVAEYNRQVRGALSIPRSRHRVHMSQNHTASAGRFYPTESWRALYRGAQSKVNAANQALLSCPQRISPPMTLAVVRAHFCQGSSFQPVMQPAVASQGHLLGSIPLRDAATVDSGKQHATAVSRIHHQNRTLQQEAGFRIRAKSGTPHVGPHP